MDWRCSACFANAKPWVQPPIPPKNKKKKREEKIINYSFGN
jgi:hypothetical protein